MTLWRGAWAQALTRPGHVVTHPWRPRLETNEACFIFACFVPEGSAGTVRGEERRWRVVRCSNCGFVNHRNYNIPEKNSQVMKESEKPDKRGANR